MCKDIALDFGEDKMSKDIELDLRSKALIEKYFKR